MKKLLFFVAAICYSMSMFAGGDIFEAGATYGVNGAVVEYQLIGINTETAPEVDLGTISQFQLDSFFIKVWQDGGDHFDVVQVGYQFDEDTPVYVDAVFKRDLGGNDHEWAVEMKQNIVAALADGDHVFKVWFKGIMNKGEDPGEAEKWLSNNSENYKFKFNLNKSATAIDHVVGNAASLKVMENGVLYIYRNGVKYDTNGKAIR